MKKIETMIESIKIRMSWEQEKIDRCMKNIKECANYDAYNLAMFMPGNVQELQRAIDRMREYGEQISMLEFLLREAEE